MLSKNNDGFVYDSYWKQWSRLLVRGGGNHIHEVSIPITPVTGRLRNWSEIAKVMIVREDVRNRSVSNKDCAYTHNLPDDVYSEMVENMGSIVTNLLVHGDVLPLIDWEKHSDLGDTFVPLKECLIKRDWYFVSRVPEGSTVVEAHMSGYNFSNTYGIGVPDDSILIGGVYHQHGNAHFRTYGLYDITLKTVTFEVMISSPEFDTVTRFSSYQNGNWADSFKKYIVGNEHVNIKAETADAVLEMLKATVNNLAIYTGERK